MHAPALTSLESRSWLMCDTCVRQRKTSSSPWGVAPSRPGITWCPSRDQRKSSAFSISVLRARSCKMTSKTSCKAKFARRSFASINVSQDARAACWTFETHCPSERIGGHPSATSSVGLGIASVARICCRQARARHRYRLAGMANVRPCSSPIILWRASHYFMSKSVTCHSSIVAFTCGRATLLLGEHLTARGSISSPCSPELL